MQRRGPPYVVEVDRLGEARSVAPTIQNYQPTECQIGWHLGRFISNVRSVSTDPVLVKRNWFDAYDFATDRAAIFLNEYARSNNPFAGIGQRSVSMQVASVVRASDASFQVKWTENIDERSSLARNERWTAMLTVVIRPPKTTDALRMNPLGLYVNVVDWARELDGQHASPDQQRQRPHGQPAPAAPVSASVATVPAQDVTPVPAIPAYPANEGEPGQ